MVKNDQNGSKFRKDVFSQRLSSIPSSASSNSRSSFKMAALKKPKKSKKPKLEIERLGEAFSQTSSSNSSSATLGKTQKGPNKGQLISECLLGV